MDKPAQIEKNLLGRPDRERHSQVERAACAKAQRYEGASRFQQELVVLGGETLGV